MQSRNFSSSSSSDMTQDSSFSLFGSSASTFAMSNTGSAGSFVFASSDNNHSSACGCRRNQRLVKTRRGFKCHMSPPSQTSDAIPPESAEQAPASPFKAKSYAEKEVVSNSPLPLTTVTRILNGIPQNPHFYQLRNYSELTRKNLISTWDHIFEETVAEIHSLQAMDFWVRAKRLWETIGELQNLGYDVIALRRRLVELSDVMMELKLSEFKIKRLKIKAENHKMEKSRLESLIVSFQAMAKREGKSMMSKLIEAARLENALPKFDRTFAKLAMEPL